jgi:heme oxygenase
MNFLHAPIDARGALRLATQSRHEQLDSSLRIGAAQAGHAEYIAYIAALRGWLEPVEQAFYMRPWPASLDLERRIGKTAWIDADLDAARAEGLRVPDSAALPGGAAIPRTTAGTAYATGVLYVVEGSQLGGRMMYKRLRHADPAHAYRYMAGYGEELGAMWKDFVDFLEETLLTQDDVRQACAGACDAFDTLGAWMALRGQAG